MSNTEITQRKRRHTGVGVLLMTSYLGQPYFVLGREEFKSIKQNGQYIIPLYEEFGGGIQYRKLGLELNACFELREETSNLLNFTNTPEVLNSGVNKYFDIPFKTDRMYRIYVVYIPEFVSIMPYFNYNRNCLLKKLKNPESKLKTYLEMDDIKLVSLDAVKHVLNNRGNYICFNQEDTEWNMTNSQPPYKGILRVDDDTFLSGRLCQFLNANEFISDNYANGNNIDNTNPGVKQTGLDMCYEIFNSAITTQIYDKPGIIRVNKPKKQNYVPENKDNYLVGTYYIDIKQD
jgi:hypothetical protein